jgi:hypothetical protein
MNVESDAQRLVEYLDETIQLLQTYEIGDWAQWLERDRSRISARDYYGLVHLLSAFGGMGSFSDVWICAANGHKIAEEQERQVNTRLQELRGEIYRLATRLKRIADRREDT